VTFTPCLSPDVAATRPIVTIRYPVEDMVGWATAAWGIKKMKTRDGNHCRRLHLKAQIHHDALG
jgi:hypothetical protein